jgi:hypothetical protein
LQNILVYDFPSPPNRWCDSHQEKGDEEGEEKGKKKGEPKEEKSLG